NTVVDVPISAALAMFPKGGCGPAEGTANTVWGLMDTNGDNVWDNGGVFQLVDATTNRATTIAYDTKAPSPVTNPTAVGAADGFLISWGVTSADIPQMRGYQVLCKSVKTGGPIFNSPRSDREYIRTADVPNCGLGQVAPDAGVGSTPDAGVAADAGTAPDA